MKTNKPSKETIQLFTDFLEPRAIEIAGEISIVETCNYDIELIKMVVNNSKSSDSMKKESLKRLSDVLEILVALKNRERFLKLMKKETGQAQKTEKV